MDQFSARNAAAAGYSQNGNGNAMDLSNIEGLEQQTDGDGDESNPAAPVTRGDLLKLLNAMQQ